MVTKISKWSRIQDSCRVTPKIESRVVYAMPDIPSKFQKDPSITFRVIAWTHRQTNKQTNKNRQKHYLLGGGNKTDGQANCDANWRHDVTDTIYTFAAHCRNQAVKVRARNNILKALTGTTWGQQKETIILTHQAIGRSVIDYATPI